MSHSIPYNPIPARVLVGCGRRSRAHAVGRRHTPTTVIPMAFARASVSFSTTAASVSTPTHSHAPRAARGTSIAASATGRDDALMTMRASRRWPTCRARERCAVTRGATAGTRARWGIRARFAVAREMGARAGGCDARGRRARVGWDARAGGFGRVGSRARGRGTRVRARRRVVHASRVVTDDALCCFV